MGFSVEYIYRILDQYSGPLKRITEETKRFQEASKAAQEKAAKMGESMRNVGYKMTAGLTLPIVGAGIATAKTAVDFQNAFIGVQKTVNASAPQLAKMRMEFERMSTQIPVSATELMKIGESAGQLGIQTENITAFTKTIAMLGATTNLAGDEGATQLARFANITQMSQKYFDRLGSTIVALGNNLATTEAEIVSMGMRLAGAGNVVKMSEFQIMAMAGTLTSLGINAEAGGTAFSKVMMDINDAVGKGGPMLSMFAKVAGTTSQQFAATFKKDAATGILSFVEGLARMQSEGKNVNLVLEKLQLQDIRVRDALLRASGSGDLFRKSMEIGNRAWKKNSALTREAELRFGSWGSQLSIVINKLRLVANDFGKIIIPIFIFFLDYAILPMLNLLKMLPGPIKALIVIFGGLVAAIGPLLIAFGFMLPALTALTTTILPALGAALATVGGVLASVTWPVWATLAAVAALVGILILAWKKSSLFRESISNLADSLKPLTDSLSALVFWIANGLSNAFSASGKEISSWSDIFRSIGDVIGTVINFIAAMVKTVLDSVAAMGKLAGAISTGNWKDAWQIATTGQSMFDIGKNAATRKEAARQDNKLEVSGQIGVSATGGAKVERAQIGLNQGYNLAVAR